MLKELAWHHRLQCCGSVALHTDETFHHCSDAEGALTYRAPIHEAAVPIDRFKKHSKIYVFQAMRFVSNILSGLQPFTAACILARAPAAALRQDDV